MWDVTTARIFAGVVFVAATLGVALLGQSVISGRGRDIDCAEADRIALDESRGVMGKGMRASEYRKTSHA